MSLYVFKLTTKDKEIGTTSKFVLGNLDHSKLIVKERESIIQKAINEGTIKKSDEVFADLVKVDL